MVMTVRTVAVIMHVQGSCSRKKKKAHINTQMIKTLSDSLFIFWGKYTSAGKTVTSYRRNRDVRTNSPDPSSTREGHSENTVWGNLAKSSRCGFCPAISTWSNAPHCLLIVQPETWLRRKTSSCYCSLHASPARKEFSLWRSGRGARRQLLTKLALSVT